MISLDTETTGIDLYHGAQPFFVTICKDDGTQLWWEWDVDPETRQVKIPDNDLVEITQETILTGEDLILQNAKFDVAALHTTEYRFGTHWPWNRTQDTLLAGHLLASNHPHDLTTMALEYLGKDIQPYEDRLELAVKEARRICKGYPSWRIAKRGLPEMPSAKEKTWKFDSWLPKTIYRLEGEGEPFWDMVLRDYSNMDSAVTLALWKAQQVLLKQRGLWEIYEVRRKLLPIIFWMERRGVTISSSRLTELVDEYSRESVTKGCIMKNIAEDFNFDLEIPKGGVNKSLKQFLFGKNYLNLPHIKVSDKTAEPSLDREVLDSYLSILPRKSKPLAFIKALRDKRKRDTAINYLEGYRRYWLPSESNDSFFILHPSLNCTGTDTLRWSSSNPNEQNISKQEGFNLRYAFGPAPGREWWAMDAENIELRIPAYEANEREMIDLFEQPDKEPYHGSYHLLVSHILHPQKFERCIQDGTNFKKQYPHLYRRVKNGNFAVQYGAVESSGTADRSYGVPGAQKLIQSRFSKIKILGDKQIAFAEKHGYVETIPDKTVNPLRGYPLLVQRVSWGGIKPTIPLNYHIQGTACWWMLKAMIRCQEFLDDFNSRSKNKYYMILQVHDELVFDFPKGLKENKKIANKLRRLMEAGGNDIGVPTPVKVEQIPEHW